MKTHKLVFAWLRLKAYKTLLPWFGLAALTLTMSCAPRDDAALEDGGAQAQPARAGEMVSSPQALRVANKYVGMFYATWFNASNICGHDARNCPPTYPAGVGYLQYRYWASPSRGKYLSTDSRAIHEHADQMSAAGVDFIIIDYSNHNITEQTLNAALTPLLDIYQQRMQGGVPTPKVVMFMPRSDAQLSTFWLSYYLTHQRDVFWMEGGRPLMLLRDDEGGGDSRPGSCPWGVCANYTIRYMWGLQNTTSAWSFMDHYPQPLGNGEAVSVSAAQQQTYMSHESARGRRYSKNNQANNGWWGENFWDQWERAVSMNPKYVLVRGWNEFVAMRTDGEPNGGFTDEFNAEFSNDIEPADGTGMRFVELLKHKTAQWKFGGNLAAGATHGGQSSDYGNASWTRAIDGNTDGHFDHGSTTHTQHDSPASWWVDLGSAHELGQVKIWNRSDCCGERLSSFDVSIDDGSGRATTIHVKGQAGSPTILDFKGSRGRYVTVSLHGRNYLSLAEVQVYPGRPDQGPLHGANFQLHARHSDKCVDTPDDSTTSVAHQWTCHGGDNQVLQTIDLGGGWWQLKYRSSGKCIDQKGSRNNQALMQWECLNHDNQKWQFIDAGDGYWHLKSATAPNKYFDVLGGPNSTDDGNQLYQWDYNGHDNQKFKLVRVP